MPKGGWDYESAEVLDSDDARVIAITRADFYDDMVEAVELVLEPNKVHLRKDIDWATKKGTSTMRAAFGLVENDDGVLEVSCIYVHRLMAGKLWERHLRYAGSPEFAPIVSKFVAAKWIVTRDFEGVGYETGTVDEKQTWWATANVLGEKGHLLPQMPMCAQPKGGFPRAVKSALEKLVTSPNPKVARLARALLALKPGEKLEEFLDGTPFVYEGERREAHKKQSRGTTPKARAAYQRRQREIKADPKGEFKPKSTAAAKRLKKTQRFTSKKNHARQFTPKTEEAAERKKNAVATPKEMPERWSGPYSNLVMRKCSLASDAIAKLLIESKQPVCFTAKWDGAGEDITFQIEGLVDNKPAGALGTRKDDCLVQCFDVARPNDFYHWWTFPVADFLGIAEPLFQDRGSARREARKRGLEGAFVPEDEVCPYVD